MRGALLTGLLVAACSGSDEASFSGGSSMGEQCGPQSVSLTSVPTGTASKYSQAYIDLSNGKIRVVLLPPGTLDLRPCNLDWTGSGPEPSWIVTIDRQELGVFDISAGDARVWTAAEDATSGTATILGYNAEDETVCGSVAATTPSGNVTGVFSAEIYCD